MIDLKYSLVIEATADPNFFGFYSPDLEGFTGVGNSIEDSLYKARWGMDEHVALLREQGMPIPLPVDDPKVVIQNARPLKPVAPQSESVRTEAERLLRFRTARAEVCGVVFVELLTKVQQ